MFSAIITFVVRVLDVLREVVALIVGEKCAKAIDWLSYKLCGRHKIQRLSSNLKGVEKMKELERCLDNSNNPALKDFRSYTSVSVFSKMLLTEKDISAEKDPEFVARMNSTFNPICEVNRVTMETVELKKIKYDTENSDHEMMLLSLWNSFYPDIKLEDRISEKWKDLGFQGTDPATDFRGMGMLGLECLLYLGKCKKTSGQLMAAAAHPQYGFSLAITSINLTGIVFDLLSENLLRNHFFYQCCHGGNASLSITDILELHCVILSGFVKFYREQKPSSIMEFNIHKEAYANLLRAKLRSDKPYIEKVE